jgi:hypothetical protein
MTNMVDAVLLKEASKAASIQKPQRRPQLCTKPSKDSSVLKAVDAKRGERYVARRLRGQEPGVGITGAKNRTEGLPCYTFADNGEGQTRLISRTPSSR